jgi:para-aminobenzoate synthetase component 1
MPFSQRLQQPLPYFPDSALLFAAIAHQPWAIFLDSCHPYSQQGRYDIFSSEPMCTLVTQGQQTTVTEGDVTQTSTQDPFLLLKHHLTALKPDATLPPFQNETTEHLPPFQRGAGGDLGDLPFNGGALGYFGYDLGRRLEKLPHLAQDAENIPDMAIGIYEWAVIVDHQQQQTWLVGWDIAPARWQALIAQFSQLTALEYEEDFQVTAPITANMSAEQYAQAFEKIKFYLTEGDCYQVNLTQRFSSTCTGNPWAAYQALRKINAAPFSAYLNLPQVQILSSSPERFLQVVAGEVETKPIKGTRRRHANAVLEQKQINDLQNSPKDRAENLMIVDLLRNDLSKSCQIGSVHVPKLFAIETYTTVHHLVSTIKGTLAAQQHALDLLRSCFPGGSITGAPKIRAMEIIEEVEPHRRGVYCGAIGYIDVNGNMDTNIAIRTLVHSDNTIRFWAGGGIVYDSVLADEYQESFDKAAALLQLLQQFRHND